MNVFFKIEDRVVTLLNGAILPGVTRESIIALLADDGVAVEVETRLAALIEHVDQGRVAEAKQRVLQHHVVAGFEFPDVVFGDGHGEFVLGHAVLL
ncbi:hypothetical protein [Mycolicibacterium poriferae]|uniref:hypothetical protein n=1 Tax=Mycolicibacterium poriferae TaxID=39694 RepID=UPI0024BAF6B3|nr:hypothetical protein [Mycolicibacterium poriferae]